MNKYKAFVAFWGFASIIFTTHASEQHVGSWDSSIYNLIEHPRTVATRIEVRDSDTGMPINGAEVLFKGVYYLEGRTSRHPEGEQNAQTEEYELLSKTNESGIAIGAFGWHKKYPWETGNDDVEKVQTIEIRHPQYQYIELPLPFKRFLDVGQQPASRSQQPSVFDAFERAWHNECSLPEVKFCVLDLGTDFSDFGNKHSSSPEFFERICNKDWGNIYQEPRNWFSKGQDAQSLCGPYFVYLMEIGMKKVRHHGSANPDILLRDSDIFIQAAEFGDNDDSPYVTTDPEWQLNFLEGLKWNMKGEEVEKILTDRGYPLEVRPQPATDAGVLIHYADMSGEPVFGKIRVKNVSMIFANRKLYSIHLHSADEAADALYKQAEELFGPGIVTVRPPSKDVKDRMESPQNTYTCERYFATTAVESKLDYNWSSEKQQFVRYSYIRLYNWIIDDNTYEWDRSSKAKEFKQLLKDKGAGKKVSCTTCNGSGHCLSCGGMGYSYEDTYIKCNGAYCNGNGRYRVNGLGGGIRVCSTCQGTGRIKDPTGKSKVPCSKCSGNGKCPICQGEGKR